MTRELERARVRALWLAWFIGLGLGTTLSVFGLECGWGQPGLSLWLMRWLEICVGLDLAAYAVVRPVLVRESLDWIDHGQIALVICAGLAMALGALFYGWVWGVAALFTAPVGLGAVVGAGVALVVFCARAGSMFLDIVSDLNRSLRPATTIPAE